MLGVARSQNTEVTHVKVHGALYNAAAVDERLATAIARAVRDVDSALWLVGMCGSEIIEAGLTAGLRVAREVFADRAYQADGKLVPRHLPGAVHMEVSLVVRQALDMVTQGFGSPKGLLPLSAASGYPCPPTLYVFTGTGRMP
ncbi:MAG: hypothetical protein DDT37_00317 [Firmicutes bacterium]|nr:hypothetical protein [candidate division NPL-UPA2 bacterium]